MSCTEVCDHCGQGLGEHLVPDSRCPTSEAATHFFMAAYASALNLDDPRHDANVVPCDDDQMLVDPNPKGTQ